MEDFNGHYSNSEEIRRMGFSQGGYSENGATNQGGNGGRNGQRNNGMQSMSSSRTYLPWTQNAGEINPFGRGKAPRQRRFSGGDRAILWVDRLQEEMSRIEGFRESLGELKDEINLWKEKKVNTDNIVTSIGDFLFSNLLNSNLPEREKLALTSFFINESYKLILWRYTKLVWGMYQ